MRQHYKLSRKAGQMNTDLFDDLIETDPPEIHLGDGAILLRGFVKDVVSDLIPALKDI